MNEQLLSVLSGEQSWCVLEGKCLDLLPLVGATFGKVDHVITDPPYSEHVHKKSWQSKSLTDKGSKRNRSAHQGIDFDSLKPEEAKAVAMWSAEHCRRWELYFCDLEGIGLWRSVVSDRYVRTCVWDKVDSSPQFTGDRPASAAEAIVCAHKGGKKRWNGGGRRNVFRHAVNADKRGKPHPTTKPDALMVELIELFTDPGDLVVDMFAGSGTTGVACVRTGRRFIGIERDPKYAALARERIGAEKNGNTLRQERAGQTTLFGGMTGGTPGGIGGGTPERVPEGTPGGTP